MLLVSSPALLIVAGLVLVISSALSAVVTHALPVAGRRRIPVLVVLSVASLLGVLFAAFGAKGTLDGAGGDGQEALIAVLSAVMSGLIGIAIVVGLALLVARFLPGKNGKNDVLESTEDDPSLGDPEDGLVDAPARPLWLRIIMMGWTAALLIGAGSTLFGLMLEPLV